MHASVLKDHLIQEEMGDAVSRVHSRSEVEPHLGQNWVGQGCGEHTHTFTIRLSSAPCGAVIPTVPVYTQQDLCQSVTLR